ncbi:MAG TPA: sugar ABC transporter permease [Devosiaceae bacterium]|nr:sugar ABC transporter permease [Devosiaceae bacterium]
MLKSKRNELLAAAVLMAPFVIIYGVLFVYPTLRMVQLSFTNAPLIGDGKFVGLDNFIRLSRDRLFSTAVWDTIYFVLLSVIPSTIFGLIIALGVNRLKGWVQSVVLACFFLPYILPVSLVYRIWAWMLDKDFGIAQYAIAPFNGGVNISIFRTIPLFMPAVGLITVWWLIGFNVLLFIAGLRNISKELYEASALDGAGRWVQFTHITWPLIWPVTVLVLTIQFILQLKIFDQVYLFSDGGRADATMVMVQYIYKQAFQQNHGGLGAAASLVLFLVIVIFSVLQFQLLKTRGGEK